MKIRIILMVLFLIGTLSSCKPKDPVYVVETTMGNIQIKLYEKTPLHKANFEKLVSEHYYDGVQFHRVIQHFMIQSGNAETKNLASGERPKGNGEPMHTIAPEFVSEYYHKRGVLAAAREGDDTNPEKRSSGSQFYIVQGRTYTENELNDLEYHYGIKYPSIQRETYKKMGGTPFLDHNYTVFGEVIDGMDVVDKIAAVATGAGDWPIHEVRIIKVTKK